MFEIRRAGFQKMPSSVHSLTYRSYTAQATGLYRSWLDSVGTSMGVQQKLMRHAQIATTMNIYGDAMMESKRAANSKVVQMALRPALKAAK